MNTVKLPNLKHLKNGAAIFAAFVFLFIDVQVKAQTPSISSFGNITYVERQNSVFVAPNITISNGSNYSDGYLEFEVASAETSDQLGISTVSTASTTNNVISVVGNAVYRGNGTVAVQIGSVDAFFNGQNGRKLRVNFSSPLSNAQFTEPVVNGQIPGWTLDNSRFNPTSALPTWFPFTQGGGITTSGSSPNFTNSGTGYNFISDRSYASIGEGRANVTLDASYLSSPGQIDFQSGVVNDAQAVGGKALRLYSRFWINERGQIPYGSVFGPVATSAPFSARTGDQLSLNWRASGSGDDYEVYAFLRKTSNQALTLLFYSRGNSRSWSTATGSIPSDDTYEFIFINGSYDFTGGGLLGAEFFIDNIRVVSAQAPNDANITALARLVAYNYTGCTPPATKSLTVRAYTANAATGSGTNTINITEVNCAPTFTATVLTNRTHGVGGSPTLLFTSSNANTQESGQNLVEWRITYGGFVDGVNEALQFDGTDILITNGTGTTAINGIDYTVSNGSITFTKTAGITATTFNSLFNNISYKSLGTLTAGARTVSLSYLKDNGGTNNGGVDEVFLASNVATSTINVIVLTASESTLPQIVRCTPASSSEESFTVSGANLQGNVTITAPTGFEVSLTSGSSFANTATITASGNLNPRTVYVRLTAAASGTPSGNISITSTGATTQSVSVSGRVASTSNLSITNSLCGNQSLLWASWNNVNATGGTGTFGNLGVTVTVSHSRGGLSTTPLMFSHSAFPSQYTVPNTVSLRNDLSGVFTFTFSQPITNPQVAFSSIGNPTTPVGINTSVPYAVVWNGQNVVYNTPTRFTGNEGNTIVSFPGTHQTITLEYLADEIYANLAFGFENFNCTAPQICPGGAVTLTASGGSSYAWSPSTGLNITNAAQVIATPTVTTTYTVTDPNNPCATPRTITVNVNQIPNAPTAAANQLICPGDRVSSLSASVGPNQSLRWFANTTGGNALAATTLLVAGNTYYAEAVDLTCGPSTSRTAVSVANYPDLIETSVDTPTLIRGTPIVIDSLLLINETNPINGALVLISGGFVSGDILAHTGTLPAGVSRSYNASSGVLTFTGTISPSDLQAILRTVTINTTSTNGQPRTVSFNIGSALPFSTNGHFYEFKSAPGISWTAAKTAAEGLTLYGRQGYLVTVTSAAENQFVESKLVGQGWMGATDRVVEGVWRWDTGPEAGQQFWQGLSSNAGGTPVNNLYNNWAVGEPNNAGDEDYAHFLSNGQWNDYPLQLNNIAGYVVEYGGMPGDACQVLSSSKVVNVIISTPPSVTTTSPIGSFTDVTASISGQVTSDGGATLTERGFVIGIATNPTTTPATGGFKIVSPTTAVGTYSGNFTGLMPNTLYYARAYAINARGTAYGNEITFTTAPAQPAAITTDRNDATFGGAIICAGTSITLTSSVATGTIEWLAGNCTGTVLGTGNTLTVSPTATTTYFARTFNSATGLRSSCEQVLVTVQAAAPTISYAAPYYLYYSGEGIATNNIVVSGSGAQAYVASYSISPALPAGLNFNTATATITGTSLNGNQRTTYTITGITPCGNVTTMVDLEVLQCSGFTSSDFALRGNATFNAGASEFVLTPATNNQFGATWNQTRLDLTQDFDINSQIFLGNNDAGADGIAFVLQPLSLNQGSSGGGLGYAGINPSVAVEFDTWFNQGSDPTANDHAAFMINGNTSDHSAGLYAFPFNIEDGQYRPARFKWEAATKTFRVFVSGTQILVKTNWDIVTTVFNNNPYVYWGFTGATGGAVNLQKVKFDRYCLTVANNTVADVSTTSPIGVRTNSTAAISGEVISDGGAEVVERGFVIGTATAPTTSGVSIVSPGTGVGPISGTFTGLQPATLYYARSYAINAIGTGYGNEISFYTPPADVTGITSSDFNSTHQSNVICYGASTTLTAAGVSGVVYWYTSLCGGTQVGTGSTITVSPTATTTYYARNFNNNLFSDGCAQITVVVRDQIVAPTISGAEIICWNSRPTGFTGNAATGGTGPWTYQWQQRELINGVWGAWTDIPQATNFAAYRPDFMFTTTEFRLLATDTGSPACTTDASSNVITVTVRDPFTPSVISVNNGAYTFCQNDQLTLTATPTLGGSGPPFQYQWQQSADSISWVNVGPAQNNQIDLVLNNLNADTYYRLIAFDLGTPGCGSVFSINGFKVYVQPTVLAGNITGSQHICAQTTPMAISSTDTGSGRGALSYRWEASIDGGNNWNTIVGANAASYQPGVLTTTTDFRRFTISTFQGLACESPLASDSIIRILVDSLPIAQVYGQQRDTACVASPYQITGGYSSNGIRVWSHNGSGSLSSTTDLQPVYTPVAADAGQVVRFTMVVTGTTICNLVTDTALFDLLIDSLPYAIAGMPDTICSNGSYQVVGASAAYGTVQWTHNGAGTLQQSNTLNPTYLAAAGDEGNQVRLILSVTSNNTCVGNVHRDTIYLMVDPLPQAVAGGSDTICSGASSQISGASSANGTILWTIHASSGNGSILNETTLTPSYVADAADAGSTVRLKMTVTSTNVCNPQVAEAYFDVVVRPDFVPATMVNQNQELCYNTTARVLTAQAATGGSGPYAYQWQVSNDSVSWTNINGATSLTYSPIGVQTSTKYYRILSTDLGNPVCGTTLTGAQAASVVVFDPLTPPLFNGNAITLCYGTQATLLPAPARGGRNDFLYQWQQSANGTSGWVNVGPPSTNLAFNTPTMISGTYYRVIARDQDFPNGDPSCGSTFSNAVRIIVADPAAAGAISGNQTICLGSNAAILQSTTAGTGSGNITYVWEADAGQGWARIAGATGATYDPAALTITTQFRRITVATLNGVACESIATNVVTVTVDDPAIFDTAAQGDTTLMTLTNSCAAAAFNFLVPATGPSAITYTYSFSGATVDTGSGIGSGGIFNRGITTVNVYATTNCSTTVHTFDITVLDTVSPTVIAQNLTVNLDANGQASITPAMVDNGSTDNCGIATRTLSTSNFSCANVGANNVTLTVTDVNGNVQTATVVITVIDAVLPSVLTQNLSIQLDANGQASITPAMVDNGSSDNCGIANLILSQTNFDCSHVGNNNVTFTVTDVNGNVNQAQVVVTVLDTLKPLVVAQNLTVALNASGQATITPAMVDNGSTDNCGIATRTLSTSNFSCSNVGANNVTLTVTDVNGNAQTASVVVTVIDTLKPIVVAQNLTVNLDANGQASITPAMVDNGSSDNCGIATRTLSTSNFSCANVGANQVILTVTDVNGNVQTAAVVVTIVDADTPVVAVQNRTVYLDAIGVGQLTAAQVDAGTSDNCGIAQISLSQTQFGCSDIGIKNLLFTATDVNGNLSRSMVQVTVLDTIAPVVTRFAADTLYVTRDACAALYYWRDSISVFDACGSFTVQSSWPNVILLNKGQHQLNFTVTDLYGNANAYSRPVVVLDTISPVIMNVPANVTIYAAANCGRTYTWVQPSASDNCTGVTMTSNFNSGDFFPLGTTQVQFTVTDAVGLTNQAGFTITVVDTTPPTISVRNATVHLNAAGQASLTLADVLSAPATDNCGVQSVQISQSNFNCSQVGANQVTITAQDVNGNVQTATVVVTVIDNLAPTATAQNVTVYLNANGQASVTAAMVNNGSSDNCGIATMTLSNTSFTCANRGNNTVTFTVTDLHGNSASTNATILVLDTIAPNILLSSDTIIAYLANNQCIAPVNLTGIQVTDNCGNPTFSTSPISGAAFAVGVTPVTITASDASGNQRQRVLYVRVIDTIAPVILNLPTFVNINYDSTVCGANVTWLQPIAIDNCSATLTSSHTSGAFFGVGNHVVTFTATDASGNVRQQTIQFNIEDVWKPVWVSVPQNIVVDAPSNGCSAVVSWTSPVAIDNCSSVTYSSSHTAGSSFPVGVTTVTILAADASSNVRLHTFTVTVRDVTAPTITFIPGNVSLGLCQSTFTFPVPTATDLCGNVIVTQLRGLPSGSVYPVGTTENVFSFVDASGNSVRDSFTVTVLSNALPFVPTNLSFCSNDSVQDLSRGFAGYAFFGSGVFNGNLFNPAQALIGNQAVDFTYTDSVGCSTNGRIFISVLPSPLKPIIERVSATTLRVRDSYDSYQWYRYGQPIPGATQQSYVVSLSGVYSVSVANNAGCSSMSDLYGFGVGISVQDLGKDGFNIYPNPNGGQFFVHHSYDDMQERTIQVLDMLGKVVHEQQSNMPVTELDLRSLAQGRYFIRISNEATLGIKSVIIRY